jgi:diguanylate cyclase (GGDEF)-like protein/PAS domain S-box-containing protein
MDLIKVSATSRTAAVAGAIAGIIREHKHAEVQAMTALRILFIEDSEDDVFLLLRHIQKGGYDVKWERVQTAGDIQAALASQPWDLILCDYSMPSINALDALETLKKSDLDLPFIIVSGAIEEEAAVFALKAGAHDFVLKSNLARLLPAIQRELKEAENRREHKQVSESLRASELLFRSTLENMIEGCQIIGYDWRYLFLNDSAVRDSHQTRESLLGRTMMECYPGIENTAMFTTLQHCMEERVSNDMLNEFIYPDGSKAWFELSIRPAPDGIFILSSDITTRKQAEQEILKLNAELEKKVAERTAELAAANEQLRQLSLFDELTGLYNRRGFLLLAEEQLSLARRAGRNDLMLFYADLDGLKHINDRLGHSAGDEAIVTVARTLNKTFRLSDIKARLGGDEFIVLAVEAEESKAQALLARLREGLAENNQALSVGVVTCDAQNGNSIQIQDIIARADEAMYSEKRKKPGRHNL